jgi:hypothetical protein
MSASIPATERLPLTVNMSKVGSVDVVYPASNTMNIRAVDASAESSVSKGGNRIAIPRPRTAQTETTQGSVNDGISRAKMERVTVVVKSEPRKE